MTQPSDAPSPLAGPLDITVGVARLAGGLAVLGVGTVAVLVAALAPSHAGRKAPAERVARHLARALLAVAGVRRRVEGGERLAEHRGLVFFNHVSYLDPVVLAATTTTRFLAAAGVRRLPLIGWVATALGTVYVDRAHGPSRAAARRGLRHALRQSPVPVALAPEGRIGPGPEVLPLRHGAFEVAADAGASIRLVALRFEPAGSARWENGEALLRAVWRLCARTAPVTAVLSVLDEVEPGTVVDAPARARRAEIAFNRRLQPSGPLTE